MAGEVTETAVLTPEDQPDKRGLSRWLLRWGVSIAILAALAWFIDVGAAYQAVVSADPLWLAFGFLANFLGTIFLPALITREAQQVQGARMTVPRLVEINLTNRFYVLILPRVAAMAIRWLRYGEGKPTATALALLVFERGVQLATLMVLAAIALWLDWENVGAKGMPLFGVVLLGSVASVLALLPFFSMTIQQLARAVLGVLDKWIPAVLSRRFHNLLDAASLFRQTGRQQAWRIVTLSNLATVLFYGSAWFVAKAMDIDLPLISLVWIRSLVFMMTLVPLTIGGIGVREASFVAFLGIIGIDGPTALAFSAVNFSIQIALALIGALLESLRVFAKVPGNKG